LSDITDQLLAKIFNADSPLFHIKLHSNQKLHMPILSHHYAGQNTSMKNCATVTRLIYYETN